MLILKSLIVGFILIFYPSRPPSAVNGSSGICPEGVYNSTIYGVLTWPSTESGATATVDCAYR